MPGSLPRSDKGKAPTMAAASDGPLASIMNQLVAGGLVTRAIDASGLQDNEAIQLERCLSSMLQRTSSAQTDLARLMDKHRALASDYDRLEAQHSRSAQGLASAEHDRELAKSRADAAAKDLAHEVARHAQSRDEAHKARLALAAVKSAAAHETKRKENEVASVLSRWQKVSSAGVQGNAATILLNPTEKVGRVENNKTVVRNGRQTPSEVALLEASINDLDAKRQAAQEENVHLREIIGDVLGEVAATLEAIGVRSPTVEESISDPLVRVNTPHLTLSPDALTSRLSNLFLQLRETVTSTSAAASTAVAAAIATQEAAANARIAELEESLKSMQNQIDAAEEAARNVAKEHAELRELAEEQQQVRSKHELGRLEKKLDRERQHSKQMEQVADQLKSELVALKQEVAAERKALEEIDVDARRWQEQILSSNTAGQRQKRGIDDDSSLNQPPSAKRSRAAQVEAGSGSGPLDELSRPLRRPVRQSTTSAALASILGSSVDTPPAAVRAAPKPLAAKPPNATRTSSASANEEVLKVKPILEQKSVPDRKTLGERPEAAPGKVAAETKPAPAGDVNDRIQKAVEAARARRRADAVDENVTRRRK